MVPATTGVVHICMRRGRGINKMHGKREKEMKGKRGKEGKPKKWSQQQQVLCICMRRGRI